MEIENNLPLSHLSIERLLKLQNDVEEELTKRGGSKQVALPVAIFRTRLLAPLEAAVKYLRENYSLSYREIALHLHRSVVCIGLTYRNAKRKLPQPLPDCGGAKIPVAELQLSRISLLESIVVYLRESHCSLHQIAVQLSRNDRTIWTIANRARVKLHG